MIDKTTPAGTTMNIFLAGIIQGSIPEGTIHRQDYRGRIKSILAKFLPGADVYCPIENHPQSLGYDDRRAQDVFSGHVKKAAESDLLITYIPEASMGTAVEMWEAYKNGTPIVTISPLAENWVVKLLSSRVVPGLDEFEALAESGELSAIVCRRKGENCSGHS